MSHLRLVGDAASERHERLMADLGERLIALDLAELAAIEAAVAAQGGRATDEQRARRRSIARRFTDREARSLGLIE